MIRGVVALSYPLIVPAMLNVTGIGTVFNAAPVIADKLAERIRAALAGGRRKTKLLYFLQFLGVAPATGQ